MENENMNVAPAEEEIVALEDTAVVEETADEIVDEIAAEEEIVEKNPIAAKCREIKDVCTKTADRLADDWREANGNPYIKYTTTSKIEVYAHPNDETPIDAFQTTRVKAFSFRAIAIATGVASVFLCVSGAFAKKFFNPGE